MSKPILSAAMASPLSLYEHVITSSVAGLDTQLTKVLIDYKRGRQRQAQKRFQKIVEDLEFDYDQPLLYQATRLSEDTAPLLVFELLMELTTSVSRWNIEAEEYIECIGWFDPDAALFHGAVYNLLILMSVREKKLVAAKQFAELALTEYRRAAVPYLEGFIYLHQAFLSILEGHLAQATHQLDSAADRFQQIEGSVCEGAMVALTQAWIKAEVERIFPTTAWLNQQKNRLLHGEFWPETFLVLASLNFRAGIAEGDERVLEALSELEIVIRVRGISSILPAMQLLRTEYFVGNGTVHDTTNPFDIPEHLIVLLMPTPLTLRLNSVSETGRIETKESDFLYLRTQLTQTMLDVDIALKSRQFNVAAQHLWPALDLIAKHDLQTLLGSCVPTVEAFLAQCRQRRRFVERARQARRELLLPLRNRPSIRWRPAEVTAAEFAVVNLLGMATSNKAMARELDVTVATVKFHLRNIYRKLEVQTRRDAIKAMTARGWINPLS